MKNQTQLFQGLGFVGALLLMVFLVIKSRSVDFEQHRQYRHVIAEQSEGNTLINQTVLRSRYALLASYDPLVRLIADQKRLRTALYDFPHFVNRNGRQEIEALLNHDDDLFERKDTLIEQFKSKNAILKNSLTYLPTLFEELRRSEVVGPSLEALLENVLLYSISSDEDLVPRIQDQVVQIEQQIQDSQPNTISEDGLAIDQLVQEGQPDARQGIELAIDHTNIILENKPQVDQLVQDILNLPIDQAIEQLEVAYEQNYQSAIHDANFYRFLVYIWLLVILGAITHAVVAQLRASGQRTVNILESITDAFISLDRQWRVTYVNSQAAEILQQKGSHLLNQNFWQIAPNSLGSQQSQHYKRAVTEQHIVIFESHTPATDSWLEVRLYPTRENLSIFLQDVTERKTAENQLRQLNQELEEVNRAKSEFLANMSHELRTPLNAIIGYSEILEEDAEDVGWSDFIPDIRKVRNAGKHLLGLINDVLDLAKIEAGRMELHLETFEIASMTREVISTIQPLIKKNDNKLFVNCPENIGRMHADQMKLRQALLNLLSNASKFTEQGQIILSVEKEKRGNQGNWIYFEVRDTGIGMTPEQLGRIFDAFAQADSSTTRKYGGTGLGLTITRRLLNTMGGDVFVESEYGRGTTFTLKLPQQVSQPDQEAAPVPITGPARVTEVLPAQGPFGTVLVIEDDPNARDLLQRSISKMGYRVVCTDNGKQGLQLAEELHPSVITLDVMLPEMDGWAVLSALKENAAVADIPVIMLTMVDDCNLGYTLGASDYLMKPISRDRLVNVLEKYKTDPLNRGILVIEDDPHSREMMCRLLDREGWSTREAANGLQALEVLQQTHPGLILLDLMMPDMDGFEFLQKLRQQPQWQSIPVIVVTAKDLTQSEYQQLNQAVQSIHQKGAFSREGFLNEVNRFIAMTAEQSVG